MVKKVVPIPIQHYCYRLMLVFCSSMRRYSRLAVLVALDCAAQYTWIMAKGGAGLTLIPSLLSC